MSAAAAGPPGGRRVAGPCVLLSKAAVVAPSPGLLPALGWTTGLCWQAGARRGGRLSVSSVSCVLWKPERWLLSTKTPPALCCNPAGRRLISGTQGLAHHPCSGWPGPVCSQSSAGCDLASLSAQSCQARYLLFAQRNFSRLSRPLGPHGMEPPDDLGMGSSKVTTPLLQPAAQLAQCNSPCRLPPGTWPR